MLSIANTLMLLIGWLIDYDSYLVAIEMLIGGLLLLVGLYLGSYVGTRMRSVQTSCHATMLLALPLALCVVQRLYLSLRYR